MVFRGRRNRVFELAVVALSLPAVGNAGHLFTQASSNTPTWIQAGQGIVINQYGDEGVSGGGDLSFNFTDPTSYGTVAPSGASGSDWWAWSAGDVMRVTLPLVGQTYVYTIAYDTAATCAYDFCGANSDAYVSGASIASATALPAHSGEQASYGPSDVAFNWSVESLAGDFALSGYRLYTGAGTIDGTGAGPLTQSSVVSSSQVQQQTGGGTPAPRDINAAGDLISNLIDAGGSALNSVFDGGELVVDQDVAAASVASFAIKSGVGNAQLNVATGNAHAIDSQFVDAASSAGALEKVGAGTLILSNTSNSYSGGTIVSGGAVEIASDAALGATSGGIVLNGGALSTTADIISGRAVTLGGGNGSVSTASATSLTFSGVVSGSGALTKTGAGTLRVTGTNTYTGGTTVSAGSFDLDGSLSSNIVVASAGKIEGVGATSGTLSAAGIVAPGNSPGTLSVAGDVTFASTNTFVTELDGLTYNPLGGAGSYDRLAVTGAMATFTAGGTVTPILRGITSGNNTLDPVYGDAFRVVTTANAAGVSGAFSGVTDPSAGMPTNSRFDVIYGADYVDLVLTPGSLAAFAGAYGIQNMTNAATAFDGIRPTQGTNGTTDKDQFFNGLYRLTASQMSLALLQASGEIHAFALSDARDGWRSGLGVVQSAAQSATRDIWFDVSSGNLSFDQDTFASSYSGTSQHLWIGADLVQASAFTLGLSAGVASSDISTVATGTASTDTSSVAAYLYGVQGAFEYDGVLSLNRSHIYTMRNVDLSTGTLTNSSMSKANGAAMTAGLGYRYDLVPKKISGLGWIRGDVDYTRSNGFTEEGSSVTALTVSKEAVKSAKISLGYTLSGKTSEAEAEAGTWSFGLGASKQIAWGTPYISRSMAMHGATWEVTVPKASDVTTFATAGLDLPLGEASNVWLNLAASSRNGAFSRNASFGLAYKW